MGRRERIGGLSVIILAVACLACSVYVISSEEATPVYTTTKLDVTEKREVRYKEMRQKANKMFKEALNSIKKELEYRPKVVKQMAKVQDLRVERRKNLNKMQNLGDKKMLAMNLYQTAKEASRDGDKLLDRAYRKSEDVDDRLDKIRFQVRMLERKKEEYAKALKRALGLMNTNTQLSRDNIVNGNEAEQNQDPSFKYKFAAGGTMLQIATRARARAHKFAAELEGAKGLLNGYYHALDGRIAKQKAIKKVLAKLKRNARRRDRRRVKSRRTLHRILRAQRKVHAALVRLTKDIRSNRAKWVDMKKHMLAMRSAARALRVKARTERIKARTFIETAPAYVPGPPALNPNGTAATPAKAAAPSNTGTAPAK